MADDAPQLTDGSRALPVVPVPQLEAVPLPAEEGTFDLRRYLAALLRRKWLILAITAAGTAAGFGATRFVAPDYLAQATLWLQAGSGGAGGGGRQTGPIRPDELLAWSAWVDLLRSFVVLDEVVRRERLYLVPENAVDSSLFKGFVLKQQFVPGQYSLQLAAGGKEFVLLRAGQQLQRAAVGDSLGQAAGFEWVPGAAALRGRREVRFAVGTPREAALQLGSRLRSILPQQGSFLRLELQGKDPVQTAATLNAIADRFVEVAADLKREKLTQLSVILRDQLNSSYADLGRAESALETFRVHTITLPTEEATPVAPGLEQTRDPVFRTFFDMRVQRDQLDHDRQAIQRVLAQPDTQFSAVQLEAVESVRESAELTAALKDLTEKEADARAMRLQFTDQHPPLQRLQAEIDQLRRRTIPELAGQLSADLGERVRDMDSRIGSASRELQQIPTRVIEEARLRRDVTIAENLYTTLQQRYEEARLAELSAIPDVGILDRAAPPENPLKDRAMMLLFGGLFGGLGGAIGLVLLLDRFDRRVRYPEQVSTELGLPILGALPRLKKSGSGTDPDSELAVVEALRSIRLNLVYAYGAAGPLVLTVTSPGSGDGKSFVASNLALSFADAGHRTLLIDADIRRGALHRVLGLQRKPGLLDLLEGHAAREAIIQQASIKGVDFIACGTRRNAGPEMLASATMSQFLIGLRSTYGVIIIDSAPLGAGVDPLVLGTLTGNLLLVLRTGVTDRALALAKLQAASRLPIRILGAILNDVSPRSQYGYGYYSYLPGYGTSEETGAEDAAPRRLPSRS